MGSKGPTHLTIGAGDCCVGRARSTGQSLAEYGLILVLVAVLVILILALVGPAVGNVYSQIVAGISSMARSMKPYRCHLREDPGMSFLRYCIVRLQTRARAGAWEPRGWAINTIVNAINKDKEIVKQLTSIYLNE